MALGFNIAEDFNPQQRIYTLAKADLQIHFPFINISLKRYAIIPVQIEKASMIVKNSLALSSESMKSNSPERN